MAKPKPVLAAPVVLRAADVPQVKGGALASCPPEAAAALLRMHEVMTEAREYCEALHETASGQRNKQFFARLAVCLGDVTRVVTGPVLPEAQQMLGLPVSYAGKSGVLPDGSRVRVGADGVVQATVSDDVLKQLGLDASKRRKGVQAS